MACAVFRHFMLLQLKTALFFKGETLQAISLNCGLVHWETWKKICKNP